MSLLDKYIECILLETKQIEIMETIIFKSEKKAKVYEIRSSKDQGVYKMGELIRRVKTDNIDKLNQDGQYQVSATEVE